jgi:hypothetical protein
VFLCCSLFIQNNHHVVPEMTGGIGELAYRPTNHVRQQRILSLLRDLGN